MHRLSLLTVFTAFLAVGATASDAESCNSHVTASCGRPGSGWAKGPCNAVFGGFSGNTDNLHKLMISHFQDSFKFLLMGSQFNSDAVNRMGMHGLLQGYSDKMWENGKSIMSYILKRGGKMGDSFQISDLSLSGVEGEVEALGGSLDILKEQTENCIRVHKHADNKKVHYDTPDLDSYDPAISHFLEEEFIEPYTDDIRTLAGHLNVLARITRKDSSKAMGLHLYDASLKE